MDMVHGIQIETNEESYNHRPKHPIPSNEKVENEKETINTKSDFITAINFHACLCEKSNYVFDSWMFLLVFFP